MIKVKYKPSKAWKRFYQKDWDIAILIGGRGAGKTFEAGNYTTLEHLCNASFRTLLLRDVGLSISQSILQNIRNRFEKAISKAPLLSTVYEVQTTGVKNITNDDQLIITKGFRKSRVEQKADLKGFEDIDLAILEEAEDIRDEDRVNSLLDTLRKEGHKVIIILNKPDLEHWIIKRYFNYEAT